MCVWRLLVKLRKKIIHYRKMWFNFLRTRSQYAYSLKGAFAQVNGNKINHTNYVSEKNNPSTAALSKFGNGYSMNQGLKLFSANCNTSSRANMAENAKVQTPEHASPWPMLGDWAKWILGSVLSLLFPLWKFSNQKLRKIEGEAELVIEELESAANVVEKVATAAEKISAEVAETIPGDNKLKEAALIVERVSKHAALEAQITKNIIHQVEVLKHEVGDLEATMEPMIEKTRKASDKSDAI